VTQVRESALPVCSIVDGISPNVPPGGYYVGTGTAKRIVSAIQQSSLKSFRDELPAWRRWIARLSNAWDGQLATKAESHLQILFGRAQGDCGNIGVPIPT
jgi:hypothetical protein